MVDVFPALLFANTCAIHNGDAAFAGAGFGMDSTPCLAEPGKGFLAGRKGRCLLESCKEFGVKVCV